ncbi:hypothetical protein ACFLXY_05025 [Chloroflexota bacterium]
MKCSRCGREIPDEQLYSHKGLKMCEGCYIHANLFPLKHTGKLGRLFSLKDNKTG